MLREPLLEGLGLLGSHLIGCEFAFGLEDNLSAQQLAWLSTQNLELSTAVLLLPEIFHTGLIVRGQQKDQ
jgi:hypothetical protein